MRGLTCRDGSPVPHESRPVRTLRSGAVSATDQEFQRSGSDRERQRAAKCLGRKVYTPSCLPSLVSIPIRRNSRITPWRSVKVRQVRGNATWAQPRPSGGRTKRGWPCYKCQSATGSRKRDLGATTSIRRSHKAGMAVLHVSKCDRFAETRLGRNHVHQEVAQSSYRDCGGG